MEEISGVSDVSGGVWLWGSGNLTQIKMKEEPEDAGV